MRCSAQTVAMALLASWGATGCREVCTRHSDCPLGMSCGTRGRCDVMATPIIDGGVQDGGDLDGGVADVGVVDAADNHDSAVEFLDGGENSLDGGADDAAAPDASPADSGSEPGPSPNDAGAIGA